MEKSESVLITGANGFVGKAFVNVLARNEKISGIGHGAPCNREAGVC